jgi:hypothetical protein
MPRGIPTLPIELVFMARPLCGGYWILQAFRNLG